MRMADYGAKAIVFSQFVNFLDVSLSCCLTFAPLTPVPLLDLGVSNPNRRDDLRQARRLLVGGCPR